MNGPETNNSPDTVRELIEAEEREALARFRDSRFGDRLKARLDNHEVPAIRPAPPGPAFRPVWVSLAVLVAIAAAAIWLLRPLSRPPLSGPLAVAAALHRSPGLRAIESGDVESGDVPQGDTLRQARVSPWGTSPRGATPLENDIASVLSRAARISAATPRPEQPVLAPLEPLRPPLGLRKVYEILVIDRSVERVLSNISQKTKEG